MEVWEHLSLFYFILSREAALEAAHFLFPAEFSRPVSSMCENHDSLSHRSISEQRHLHSPSGDEQETEMEPSLEQDEDEREQEPDHDEEKRQDGNVTPSRKKEIRVLKSVYL